MTGPSELANHASQVFGKLLALLSAGNWNAAVELFDAVAADRPYVARCVAENEGQAGALLTKCLHDRRSIGFVNRLLSFGASPNQRPSGAALLKECMAAHSSFTDSNREVFGALLRGGADPNAIAEAAGVLPLLHWAIVNRQNIFISDLLDFGADPHLVAESGQDAFGLAEYNKLHSALEILMLWERPVFDWEVVT